MLKLPKYLKVQMRCGVQEASFSPTHTNQHRFSKNSWHLLRIGIDGTYTVGQIELSQWQYPELGCFMDVKSHEWFVCKSDIILQISIWIWSFSKAIFSTFCTLRFLLYPENILCVLLKSRIWEPINLSFNH